MKDKVVPVLIVLGLSILCAFVVVIPWNTLSSPLNSLAAPSVCGGQSLQIERDSDAYIQGEQTHQVTAYCVDSSGNKQDVSNQLIKAVSKWQVVTMIVTGLILFGLGMLSLRWAARRLNIPFEELFKPSVRKK